MFRPGPLGAEKILSQDDYCDGEQMAYAHCVVASDTHIRGRRFGCASLSYLKKYRLTDDERVSANSKVALH